MRKARPPHEVFEKINMMQGDPHKCWPWKGTVIKPNGPDKPVPVFMMGGKRYMARRLVYSLKKGIHYDRVDNVYMICGNSICCNPSHMGTTKSNRAKKILCDKLDNQSRL